MPDKDLTKFDIRTLRRNIQKGVISKTEYEDYLKNLRDEEGNYELVPLYEEITKTTGLAQPIDTNQSTKASPSSSELQIQVGLEGSPDNPNQTSTIGNKQQT